MLADRAERVLTIDGDYGLIRYRGQLPGKEGEFIGIEWEEASKGKHSGIFQGMQIFTVQVENSASFLPSNSKKILSKIGFQDALIQKYQEAQPDDGLLALGDSNIPVETVGWDKIKKKQFNLSNLNIVGLAGYGVAYCCESPKVQDICPKIEDLDLSRNLFNNWRDIMDITTGLSRLESLRLTYNRFNPLNICLQGAFNNLKRCILNATLITWKDLIKVTEFMPVLEELHFGSNRLSELESIGTFKLLKVLNLEDNLLDSWEKLSSLKTIPTLQVLYLQNNPIKNILYSTGDFPGLGMLNVQDSKIQDWGHVHLLNSFPCLTEIRLKNVPILDNVDDVQATLTARLGKVKVLNGSKLSDRRRLDAELWYLNQSYKEKDIPNFDQIHPRYQDLVNIHGEPVAVPLELSSNILKDRLLTITIKYENQTIQKKFTSTVKIRSLKALISKLFRISLSNVQIYLTQDDVDTELDDDWKDLAWYDVKNGCEFRVLKI